MDDQRSINALYQRGDVVRFVPASELRPSPGTNPAAIVPPRGPLALSLSPDDFVQPKDEQSNARLPTPIIV